MKNKKVIKIPFLNIDENYYIENDKVKIHLNENQSPQQGTWDEVWDDVMKIIKKASEYDANNNFSNIRK